MAPQALSMRKVVLLILMAAVVRAGVAWAGGPESAGKEAPGKANNVPYLRIATPDGVYHIKFFGESDGPIEIPLKHDRFTALLLAPELTEQGWRVSLGLQEEVLKVSPVGQLDLTMGREVPIAELERAGIENWVMKLELGPPITQAIDGCCGCGRINCCPFSGKCMSCSSCGMCCGGPMPV